LVRGAIARRFFMAGPRAKASGANRSVKTVGPLETWPTDGS
jgi:hypothetical protein